MICSQIPKSRKSKQTVANVSKKVATYAIKNRTLVKQALNGNTAPLVNKVAKTAVRAATRKAKNYTAMSQQMLPIVNAVTTSSGSPVYRDLGNGNAVLMMTQALTQLAPNSASYGGGDFLSNPASYRVWEFPVNTLISAWYSIAQKAVGFERFKVKMIKLRYANNVPTTTNGNICISYLGDPGANIPSDFTALCSLKDAVTSHVANSAKLDFSVVVRDKIQGEGYTNTALPNRRSSGDYIDADLSSVRLNAPFSILIGAEGLGGGINMDTNLGRLYFDVEIEFIKAKQANDLSLSYIGGAISFDVAHPVAATGFSLRDKVKSMMWVASDNSFAYIGYTPTKYAVTFDFTMDPGTIPPANILSVYSITGSSIPVTVNDSIDATSIDGRRILHFDGTITVSRGDYVVVDGTFPWAGAFNFNLTPLGSPLQGWPSA